MGARESSQVTFAIEALFSEKSIADIGGVSRCTQTCTARREERKRGGGFRGTSRILVVAIVVVVVDVVEVIYMHAEVAFTVRERIRNTYNDT